jgi:hypothetical protein
MAYVNVIFNSNYKISGTNSDANYYIDWSAILKADKQYLMQWTYIGRTTNTFNGQKLATLNMNIYGENYSSSTQGAPLTTNFGNLFAGGSLYATTNDNTPILLMTRPTNNNVNVQILTNDNPPVEWTDNSAIPAPPADYILTLTFSELK